MRKVIWFSLLMFFYVFLIGGGFITSGIPDNFIQQSHISNILEEKRLDNQQTLIDLNQFTFHPHSPIIIRGNEAFSNFNFSGTG